MNYLPLQIIVTLFILLVAGRVIKKFKDRLLKPSELAGWLMLWLGVLTVFWLPQTTSYLASLLGIGRGVDLAIYLALLLLFYLILRLYLKLDKQQQEITKIVRHLALIKAKDDEELKQE